MTPFCPLCGVYRLAGGGRCIRCATTIRVPYRLAHHRRVDPFATQDALLAALVILVLLCRTAKYALRWVVGAL